MYICLLSTTVHCQHVYLAVHPQNVLIVWALVQPGRFVLTGIQ